MSNKLEYPPLQLIKHTEKQIPEFFEKYDTLVNNVNDHTLEFSAAHKLVDYCYPTLSQEKKLYSIAPLVYVLSAWRKNKMVYSFSSELQKLIYDTEEFQIDTSLFDYLPYQTFYIELNDVKNFHGILIRYTHNQFDHYLTMIPIRTNPISYIVEGFHLNKGKNFYETIEQYVKMCGVSSEREHLKKCLIIGFQASMYLCAQNSDVQENEEQKRIYRPSERIKNKFSEIRKWDVGYRIVKENKNLKEMLLHSSNPIQHTEERRRPRMHWRKAHWHTFWAGEGRTKKVLHFLAPILVNETNDEIPIVEHVSD